MNPQGGAPPSKREMHGCSVAWIAILRDILSQHLEMLRSNIKDSNLEHEEIYLCCRMICCAGRAQICSDLLTSPHLSASLCRSLWIFEDVHKYAQICPALRRCAHNWGAPYRYWRICTDLYKSAQMYAEPSKTPRLEADLHRSEQILTDANRCAQIC